MFLFCRLACIFLLVERVYFCCLAVSITVGCPAYYCWMAVYCCLLAVCIVDACSAYCFWLAMCIFVGLLCVHVGWMCVLFLVDCFYSC